MRNLKRVLSLALAAFMLMGMMVVGAGAASKDFTDADEIKNVEAVDVMVALGVLEGGDKGDFQPNSILTREQAAKIICYMLLGEEAAEKLTTNYSIFSDVPANRWSAPYISYCVNLGILAGDGNGHFFPEGKLTGVAFAKMLMVCLGYNATRENYVGNNWEINVSAAAIAAGVAPKALDLSKELSRQDAAQMAFNTLEGTMVEYLNDNTIIIGDTTVSTVGKASAVAQNPYTNTMGGEHLQFAEKYFKDLKKVSDADVFGRPSTTWTKDGETVGTYVNYDLMVGEYTTTVKSNELYSLLGKSIVEKYDINVFVDGKKQPVSVVNEIVKNNKTTFSVSGDGALTQVFVDSTEDAETVTISVVNTYLAKAEADYNTKSETASFTIWGLTKSVVGGVTEYTKTQTTGSEDKATGVKVHNDDVTVSDIVADQYVLVTVAQGEVQSVEDVTIVADATITAFSLGSSVTADGEKYDYAETAEYDYTVLDAYSDTNMKAQTYNIYVDKYGYMIGLDIVDPVANYVFITGMNANSSDNLANGTYKVNGIFLDGTAKTFEAKEGKSTTFTPGTQVNQWYTYSEDNGVYTLTAVGTNKVSGYKVAQGVVDDASAVTIDYAHTSLSIATVGSGVYNSNAKHVFGNNDSVYLTAKLGRVGTTTVITGASNVVTGVKNASILTYAGNAETTSFAGGVGTDTELPYSVYVLYKSNGYVIGAVAIGSDSSVSSNIAYINSSAPSKESYDSATGLWTWERKVVINGEETVLKETSSDGQGLQFLGKNSTDGNMQAYTWYKVSYNADGYVIGATKITGDNGKLGYVSNYAGGAIQNKIDAAGIDTVIYEQDFTNRATLPTLIEQTLYLSTTDANGFFIAEDAKVVFIQMHNGVITTDYSNGPAAVEAAISSLIPASDNKYDYSVNALIDDGAAKVVIIEDVTNGTAGSGNHTGSNNFDLTGVKNVTNKGTWMEADLVGTGNIPANCSIVVDLMKQNNAEGDGLIGSATFNTYGTATALNTITGVHARGVNITTDGNYYMVIKVVDTDGNVLDSVKTPTLFFDVTP